MNKRLLIFCSLAYLLSSAVAVQAGEQVRTFSGDRNAETAEFEVEAPWLIDWIVNSDYPGSMGLAVSLINARSGAHEGYVLKTKKRGNGVRLMNEGGVFLFKVDATFANWTLKVEQLSREEAELYTPADKGGF